MEVAASEMEKAALACLNLPSPPTPPPPPPPQMEVAAREMEKAALVMSGDLPVTLLEIEKAGKEFGALGQQLNAWTRILARTPAAPGGAGGGGDREGEGGGESGGGAATAERSALQKVVEDAVTLTNVRRSGCRLKGAGWCVCSRASPDKQRE